MSAQDSANPAVQALLHHIETSTTSCTVFEEAGAEPPVPFVSQVAIQTYFQDNSAQITKVIQAACGTNTAVTAKWVTQRCPISFCILISLGYGDYIRHFLDNAGLWDVKLPFGSRPDDFPRVPGNPDFFNIFREAQWRFFPVTISRTPSVKFPKELPLPLVERKRLRKENGITANLYRVTIHRDYDDARTGEQAIDGHRYYALKTYRGKNAEVYYRTEVENFAKLCIDHREPPPGLIRFHCGFEHNGTYNLLMDFATFGTLKDLFKKEEPPSSGRDILELWKQFSLVVQALTKIHDLDLSEDDVEGFKVFQGWHQDIRPENILIHSQGSTAPHEFRFMLGDLGLSHFVRMSRSDDDPTAIDTMGTRTYGAPEIHRHSDFSETRRIPATRAIDIWSLGCVMLELCVWLVRGRTQLKSFAKRRVAENDSFRPSAGDCFHDGQQPHPSLSPVVEEEVRALLENIRISDNITGSIVSIIERMLRPEPKARPHAPEILADIERAIELARMYSNGSAARPTQKNLESAAHGRSASEPTYSTNLSRSETRTSTDTTLTESDLQSDSQSVARFAYNSGALPQMHRNTDSDLALSGAEKLIAQQENQSMRGAYNQRHAANTPSTSGHHGSARTSIGRLHSASEPIVPNHQTSLRPGRDFGSLRTHHETQHNDDTDRISPTNSNWKEPRHSLALRHGEVPSLSVKDAIEWKKSNKRWFGHKMNLDHAHYREWLDNRDHVFLIDDSQSMDKYKKHLTTLVDPLVYLVKDGDPDGVEVVFTISTDTRRSKKSSQLTDRVVSRVFKGKTDISDRLGRILREYRVELDRKKLAHQSVRPLSIYILTDGVWEGGKDAQTPIREIVSVLRNYGYDREQVGIQFISFGDDLEGLQRLDELDSFGKQPDVGLDIVDTESSMRNVWKMLLGAIDKTFDDDFDDKSP